MINPIYSYSGRRFSSLRPFLAFCQYQYKPGVGGRSGLRGRPRPPFFSSGLTSFNDRFFVGEKSVFSVGENSVFSVGENSVLCVGEKCVGEKSELVDFTADGFFTNAFFTNAEFSFFTNARFPSAGDFSPTLFSSGWVVTTGSDRPLWLSTSGAGIIAGTGTIVSGTLRGGAIGYGVIGAPTASCSELTG
jgi:hypothetical protein